MFDFVGDTDSAHRVLDGLVTRSKVIMHNLANQNTPGYKAYRVRFEELLRQAADSGKPLGEVRPEIFRDNSGAPGANNVSAMAELALLDKVRILHDVFSRRAAGYFSHMTTAIRGRI